MKIIFKNWMKWHILSAYLPRTKEFLAFRKKVRPSEHSHCPSILRPLKFSLREGPRQLFWLYQKSGQLHWYILSSVGSLHCCSTSSDWVGDSAQEQSIERRLSLRVRGEQGQKHDTVKELTSLTRTPACTLSSSTDTQPQWTRSV